MEGHQDLIALRLRGRVPHNGVFIEVVQHKHHRIEDTNPDLYDQIAPITVRPEESVDALDLRCVVGLKVLVVGERGTDRTVRAVCAKAAAVGAKLVRGAVRPMKDMPLDDMPASAWVFGYTKEPACT